jgi:hypothetical protein
LIITASSLFIPIFARELSNIVMNRGRQLVFKLSLENEICCFCMRTSIYYENTLMFCSIHSSLKIINYDSGFNIRLIPGCNY